MKYSQEQLTELFTKYGKGIPVRPRDKKNRFFIDNEAIDFGYAKAFGRKWLVYETLAKHANAKLQACFLSYDTLLEETGLKSRNAIAGIIAALVELNIIAIREVPGILSTVYYLVDSSKWKPVTSIIGATGRIVIKRGVKQYLKEQKTSIADDTLNQSNKSYNEIMSDKHIENKEKYETLKPIDDGREKRLEQWWQKLRDQVKGYSNDKSIK